MSGTSSLGGVAAGVWISIAEGDGQQSTTEMGVVRYVWNRKGGLDLLSWLSPEVTQGNGESKVKLKSEGSVWRPG